MHLNIRTVCGFVLFCALITGCVEESPNPVVFDQELKSVKFENRLFTPIVVYRDGIVLDTLPAEESRTYPVNRRGIVRHAWSIVPPRGSTGLSAGIAPYVEIGIQYDIEARYVIKNSSVPDGTIFTPRIANFSPYDLQLYVNYNIDDEFITDYIIPRNGITSDEHAPYFYWKFNSNIYLDRIGAAGFEQYSRSDTGEYELKLDTGSRESDAGATVPITVR